jgi:hypothetical protein
MISSILGMPLSSLEEHHIHLSSVTVIFVPYSISNQYQAYVVKSKQSYLVKIATQSKSANVKEP